ncbi:unnamed protein product [Urochloa decumbens]|uniref:RING-type E3 ubiquitin transferase n=1 Tax=Urochloa decumbens TaxID=240449 RepID=A0ABC9CYZ1_9POAL
MDWSEEGIDEEEEPSLRRRSARRRSPPAPRAWAASGSRSPSPRRGGLTLTPPGSRSPSPRRAGIMATRLGSSVRTTRRSPPPRTPGEDTCGHRGGGVDTGVEEVIAEMKEGLTLAAPTAAPRDDAETSAAGAASSSGGGGGGADEEEEEELRAAGEAGGFAGFSFQELEAPRIADGAEVLDAFAGSSEEAKKAKAAAEFLEATMGANTGPRTEALKAELVAGGRVLDIAGLERWMRRTEAVAELEWFAGMCCDEGSPEPELELFECAFRALENAAARELHRGANARRRWVGAAPVPGFFFCPVSDKVMEDPVVVASGKTVDRSALEEWWKEHGRICPVTGEVLSHNMFIPNKIIKLCIERWRAANKSADVTTAEAAHPPAIPPEVEALFKQVTLMPHSPRSSKEVRDALLLLSELLAAHESAVVHLIGSHTGTVAKLASVLPETCLDPDPELDDVIIGALSKAASYGPNKAVIGDDRYAVPVLIARAFVGPVAMRAQCAHILGLLADGDHCNKVKIGELGGLAPLVELLRVGDRGVKRTAARAIASICEARENRSRFKREGVVDAAISALRSDGIEVEAEAVLLQAAGSHRAMEEIIFKLQAFQDDEVCQKMAARLWRIFVLTNPEGKLDALPSTQAASKEAWDWEEPSTSSDAERSSTSSEGSADEKATRKRIKEDVKVIVSWLQKRSYSPRTYRYRD